ncbi:MAG: glycosyltransferase family 2 protein [Candidatus Desulfaltia sp.]|nr:glycosyltransferase family 2 protein [Candidatus Desulfaltia sp.]
MDYKSISIVIPTYNGKELLKKYLPSVIAACKQYSFEKVELIVVDDASSDETVEYLKSKYPHIKRIEHSVNKGFSATANDGIFAAKNRIVVLLNSDVHISEDFLQFLPRHFENGAIFAVRPGLKSSIDDSGDDLENPRIGGEFKRGFFNVPLVKRRKHDIAFFAGGGAAAFDKKKFEQLGGFDEIFSPFYYEDVDLSYRAWKRGWNIVYEPESQAYHQSGATIGKTSTPLRVQAIAERNRYFLVWKNILDRNLLFQHIIFIPLRIGISLLKGRIAPTIGFFCALKSIKKVLIKRKHEMQFLKRKDYMVFNLFAEQLNAKKEDKNCTWN